MYMRPDTPLPNFVPLPRTVLKGPLSAHSKLLYALLLSRAVLSARRGQTDEAGRVYIFFPIQELARELGSCARSVYRSMKELEARGLVRRNRQGLCRSSHIYVLIPPDMPEVSGPEVTEVSGPKVTEVSGPEVTEVSGPGVTEVSGPEVTEMSPKYTERRIQKKNKREMLPPAGQGVYHNVFVDQGQLAELERDFPGQTAAYVERLSTYLEQSGKHYASHAAVLRRWLTQDRPVRRTEELYGEDECL